MEKPQTLEVPGYQVLKYLGTGARSSIWQIRNLESGEIYALKRVVKQHASDQRFLDQAINEYEVGRYLKHNTIRRVYDLHRLKKWFAVREIHLVMEFCQGKTIQERRIEDVLENVRAFIQVAEGLVYMNAQGIIHADMKPNNIVVAGEQAKIIDLGQSCQSGTVKTRIQGTPDFIAPEQVQRRPLDARTDVFNFGATLYWALTGTAIPTVLPKQQGLRTPDRMQATPVDELNPEVPRPLANLVTHCIQYQPRKRIQTMEDVLSRLQMTAHILQRQNGQGEPPQTEPAESQPDEQPPADPLEHIEGIDDSEEVSDLAELEDTELLGHLDPEEQPDDERTDRPEEK
ncbi:MAG: protein kinase domain-containing protein [Planctomycetota bacterium]